MVMSNEVVETLERVKPLLGIHEDDFSQDSAIAILIQNVMRMIILKIPKAGYIPEELLWIVDEATMKRYNKLGSEGLTTETNEGVQFIYNKDGLLDEYIPFIEDYLDEHPELRTKGKFRMM